MNVGDKVAFGQKIGIRGTSGHSTATHLHFYLTKEISAKLAFSFSNLKANCINPVPYLYYSKEYNTLYISANSWKKPLPAPIPEVVQPVSRDTLKDQVICHEDNLRVRTEPSLNGSKVGHIEKDKYYNFYEVKEADGYKWYRLEVNQWVAGIDELEVLPKVQIVNPTERDESKDQLICSVGNLRVRTEPSLKAVVLGYLQQEKYYDYYESINADGYEWLKIADSQYVAKIDELKLLPKEVFYEVEKGDTLESIALKCSVSLEQLVKLNPQLVSEGMKLRIK